ncbi:winged helix family transcriptional regulator [Vibrio splendidus]|uniref:OmpR/PhoB-type domain-containing protein n=1 Tax=Vibrio lentus TaxID=136468 RepID=A0A855IMI7_9VIBR|nr:helix-turn-helix domain-containing protein [Vibrio lentus]PHN85643.1 winged helix family transcriptional regulator [Vibrio splendidus]MCB5362125.1 helix-turn-helix domain-containing protein [Vibrio lentus]MCB5452291.1 helix-turn-helix domain-containing protein [Vibrio lentus]MCB5464494.1 helix-turn-helix domain-containing protein [Vibrio lentus]MCC4795112.1 helix-turn-helix domain-containing protein [Vibrio lentus]
MKITLHHGSLRLSIEDCPTIKPIQLTLSEFLVLEELLAHKGEHLTKHHLLKAGWPNSYVCNNALNMVIMSLRKKLLRLGGWIEISTIHRVGYSLHKN